jgi:hypothetical protein
MQYQRLVLQTMQSGRAAAVSALGTQHRHIEEARRTRSPFFNKDNITVQFLTKVVKFQSGNGISGGDNRFSSESLSILLEFLSGTAGVNGCAGVVTGKSEKGKSVLGTCRKCDNHSVVRTERASRGRIRKNECGYKGVDGIVS